MFTQVFSVIRRRGWWRAIPLELGSRHSTPRFNSAKFQFYLHRANRIPLRARQRVQFGVEFATGDWQGVIMCPPGSEAASRPGDPSPRPVAPVDHISGGRSSSYYDVEGGRVGHVADPVISVYRGRAAGTDRARSGGPGAVSPLPHTQDVSIATAQAIEGCLVVCILKDLRTPPPSPFPSPHTWSGRYMVLCHLIMM